MSGTGSVLGRLADWRDRTQAEPAHSTRVAAWLGVALGVSFAVCFLTGIYSHLHQHPPSWYTPGPRPAGLYRITQGLHVATGIALIPLLLAKLWVVFPRLFTWPPVEGPAHLFERLALVPLVGGAIFQLVTGTANIQLWYPWPFFFPAAHYWIAWVTVGALVVHVGAKARTTRDALRRSAGTGESGPVADRRRFLGAVAASVLGITALTVGQTVAPLRRLALLAPRRPDIGPQGFPVNRTAAEAGVTDRWDDPDYTVEVVAGGRAVAAFGIGDLRAMELREATLPIACVEGWSASPAWRGVPVAAVLDAAGVEAPDGLRVESIQTGGLYRASELSADQLADRDTLLALDVGGEPLHPDHGAPVRLVGPNRPGVLQTKWVGRLVVA